jgi:hypothetical protein
LLSFSLATGILALKVTFRNLFMTSRRPNRQKLLLRLTLSVLMDNR